MTIIFPANRKEVADRMKTDVQAALPAANPFLKNSYIGALIVGFAGRIYDFYLQLENLILQIFPNTATGIFLALWGALVGIIANPSTQAQGYATFVGTAGFPIPQGTALVDSNGDVYTTMQNAAIAVNPVVISSLTRSGVTATAVTAGPHNLASGMSPTISGATGADYNITAVITVTGDSSFTYTVANSPVTPDTGAPVATTTSAAVEVISTDSGVALNQPSGTQLTLQTSLPGVTNTAYVQYDGITGGTDPESDPDYFERVNFRYENPVALFNVAAIQVAAKNVPGVTRVFVEPCTPYVGAVTIFFTRDNDPDIIPTGTEVATVEAAIMAIAPATTDIANVIVEAPTPVTVNFAFSALSPDTATMQAAIKANLLVLFQEGTSVGQNLLEVAYNAAIFQTIDTVTGATVSSFTLSTPTTDIAISAGQLPVLGSVTFA